MRDVNELARQMREQALAKEFDPVSYLELQRAREANEARVEELKKLYFNAGRWAGGARDHTARKAFEQVNYELSTRL